MAVKDLLSLWGSLEGATVSWDPLLSMVKNCKLLTKLSSCYIPCIWGKRNLKNKQTDKQQANKASPVMEIQNIWGLDDIISQNIKGQIKTQRSLPFSYRNPVPKITW